MVNLSKAFHQFKKVNALVIGDFMLDKYTLGKVKRISPEAPVSILKVEEENSRAGGAGNVALNLLSLGAEVSVIGRVGCDAPGRDLTQMLAKERICVDGMYAEKDYQTPIKNRLIAEGQQVLRVDFEESTPLSKILEQQILNDLDKLFQNVDVIAVSDYNKGFLSDRLLEGVIETGKKKNIPVIIDPKGLDFSKYTGATMIKPNQSEAYAAAGMDVSSSLSEAAKVLLEKTQVEWLLITRSKDGMSLFSRQGERFDFAVRSHEVTDVTGAGDTVLAMMAIAVANGIDMHSSVQFANIAASLSIERVGCVRVSISEFARRLLEKDSEMKVFDESHLYALQNVLQDQPFVILGIDASHGITTEFFKVLKSLANSNEELILYVRGSSVNMEFVQLLSSLHEVNYIILQQKSLESLCRKIHPSRIFVMQDNELNQLESSSALFAESLA